MTRAETDMRVLLAQVARSIPLLLVTAALAAAVVFLWLDRLTPLYRAEARLLVGTGHTSPAVTRSVLHSEIQLIRSRDIAEGVASSLALATAPEFRQVAESDGWLRRLLVTLGLARDLRDATPEERVLAHFDESLSVTTLDGSPVIVIAFLAADPELAARAANAVAEVYLALRRSATAEAAAALEAEIDRLRATLAAAELRIDALREEIASLPAALADTDRAALQAELEASEAAAGSAAAAAAAIRTSLERGVMPEVPAFLEDPAVRRLLGEQRALRNALAEETLANPLGNPRVAEIRARLAAIDIDLRGAADRIARDLEASADRARARASELARRLADAEAAAAAASELAKLERETSENRERLDAALRRQDMLREGDVLPGGVQLLSRAVVPATPHWPNVMLLTGIAFLAVLILGAAIVAVRSLTSGRATRRVPFEPLADLDLPPPAAARFRRIDDEDVPRAMPEEPTLAPAIEERRASLGAVADSIAGQRRVVVTLAEDSDAQGRPLAAVALARALAGRDRSVVLVDLHDDGADSTAMGEPVDLPGFADLLSGKASFAQTIFPDRRSRAHFIPAGREPVQAGALAGERLATLLAALDHTYDHVVIDCPDEAIAVIAPGADAALVASEYGSTDPRTVRAVSRVARVSAARIFHLKVDPGRKPSDPGPEPAAEAA